MACPLSSDTASNVVINVERGPVEKLQIAFTTTCEKFISYIKFSLMRKHFREIYNEKPEDLKSTHDQLCSQMKKDIVEELGDLSKEFCIDFLLNSLETLKQNQESSSHSWRPSGNPEEDLRDHIYPLKLTHKEDLQAVLTKLQLSNEELISELSVNHGEILHLKKCNDDLHEVFSNVTNLFSRNQKNLQETLDNVIEEA